MAANGHFAMFPVETLVPHTSGIAASLLHEGLLNDPRWAAVRLIKGLLDRPLPAALGLAAEGSELGADDPLGAPPRGTSPRLCILDHVLAPRARRPAGSYHCAKRSPNAHRHTGGTRCLQNLWTTKS